jgi:hypothetical protein
MYTQISGNVTPAGTQGAFVCDIYDYSNTTKYKTIIAQGGASQNNSGAMQSMLSAGTWRNTSAITSITFTPGTANFQQYSHFALYGMR